MELQKVSEAISLGLTVPTIILSLAVVRAWGPRVWFAIQQGKMSEAQWLILGVSISFVGAFLDNLYWSIPWTLHYISSVHAEFWFLLGVHFNVFFRQSVGVLAALCHLRSFYAGRSGYKSLAFLLMAAHIGGVAYVVILRHWFK
jgi:hypothetical protein